MKTKIASLFIASMIIAGAAAPSVGSISKNVSLAVRDGDRFQRKDLNAYRGKIFVLMMMTPWCPIYQRHASAVGDGILDYFNSPSRKKLWGKNANGIRIESILLTPEGAPQWDGVNRLFGPQNGFKNWGLDAKIDRTRPRTLLGYFRVGFINSKNLYDWGDDRRRLVVTNLIKGSASHQYRQIVINQNAFGTSDAAAARSAINAIKPPRRPVPTPFGKAVSVPTARQ
jgi:hypothetical protein